MILKSGEFALGEVCSAEGGYLPAEAEIIAIAVEKEVGGVKYYKLTLSKAATSARFNWKISCDDLAYNAAPAAVRAALEGLPAIGSGNVSVTGSPGDYTVLFEGALAGRFLAPMGRTNRPSRAPPTASRSRASPKGGAGPAPNGGREPNGPKATRASTRPTAKITSPPRSRALRPTPPTTSASSAPRPKPKARPPSASTPTPPAPTRSSRIRRSAPPIVSNLGDLRDHDELRPRRRHDRPQERRNDLEGPSRGEDRGEQGRMRSASRTPHTKSQDGDGPDRRTGTVDIAADLTGLLPAQTYCVRVTATNSAGPAQPANASLHHPRGRSHRSRNRLRGAPHRHHGPPQRPRQPRRRGALTYRFECERRRLELGSAARPDLDASPPANRSSSPSSSNTSSPAPTTTTASASPPTTVIL